MSFFSFLVAYIINVSKTKYLSAAHLLPQSQSPWMSWPRPSLCTWWIWYLAVVCCSRLLCGAVGLDVFELAVVWSSCVISWLGTELILCLNTMTHGFYLLLPVRSNCTNLEWQSHRKGRSEQRKRIWLILVGLIPLCTERWSLRCDLTRIN